MVPSHGLLAAAQWTCQTDVLGVTPRSELRYLRHWLPLCYNREGIDIQGCVAWISDGAKNMRKASRLVQERGDGGAGESMFAVNCFAHRVDLVVRLLGNV